MKKEHSIFTIIIFSLLFSYSLLGQEQYYLPGKVLDKQTNEPLVFVNIRIKDRALGIITNIDGSFRIPLKYKEYGDIIQISSMGYETKEISIVDFSQEVLNIIKLNPSAISLQEAVVKAKVKGRRNLNAKQIVQKALDAISRNFPTTSFSNIGYYRDYQFKDGQYINLNESILETFDQGFDQLDDYTSQTMLYNVVMNTDFEQDSLARSAYDYNSNRKIIKKAHLDAYGGNEYRILRIHDAIRNYNVMAYDFIGTLKTDLIKNHFFLRTKDTNIDNEELYAIKFWVYYPDYRANGTIYISKLDFAIYKLEYTMYDDKKKSDVPTNNKHGHRQKVIFDIATDYRKINNKMYLNYISFHNNFTVFMPPKFKVNWITIDKSRIGFLIEYNNQPIPEMAVDISNYDVEFNGKRVKIKKALRLKNTVVLYPLMENEKLSKMFIELSDADDKGEDLNTLLNIKIKDVRDLEGNLINKWTELEYQQFREFFVQRVKPNNRAPFEGVFMNNKKPIFTAQPTFPPKEFGDYWMNTPLNKNIN
tara:strand:+ start:1677 stop:3275 length:1599 start_codon:yes stop_codon:yes gene_type:complete